MSSVVSTADSIATADGNICRVCCTNVAARAYCSFLEFSEKLCLLNVYPRKLFSLAFSGQNSTTSC